MSIAADELHYSDYTPTKVLFGAGTLNELHNQQLPGRRALLVISNGTSTIKHGYLDRVQAELRQAGVEWVLYNNIGANPTKEDTEKGALLARQEGCDFVVALGGGSVMDAGKLMAMLAPQPSSDLWDYARGKTGKNMMPPNPSLPWVAITTTAGTGSEVDAAGVISKLDTHEKIGIRAADIFARIAIVDPELMLSVPAHFTAYQGFDAFFHSAEGHITNKTNLLADMFQMAAVSNVARWLPVAVKDGANLEARTHVAFANTMSGYSMVHSACSSMHPLEHALSAFNPAIPHGAGLILLSRAYFSYWAASGLVDERLIEMARVMGKPDAQQPTDFVDALVELQRACGVGPEDLKMSDFGITRDDLPKLVEIVRGAYGYTFAQDRATLSDEDILGIYEASWS